MSTKTSSLVGFVMLAVIAGQGLASAEAPTLSLEPTTGPPTTQVDVTGAGFQPEEVVGLSFGTKARGTASADVNGAFSTTIGVPRSASAGDHQVTATGEISSLVASATFTVVLPSIALSRSVGPPTTTVTVSGVSFRGLESIEIAFDGEPIAQATAGPAGAFSTPMRVPQRASSGPHEVTATGGTSGLIGQATFTVRIDKWPQYGFDAAHSGVNPKEDLLDLTSVSDLTTAWTVRTGPAGNLASELSSPAVVKGIAYVGAEEGKVYALDAWTGEIRWDANTGYSHNWSSPAVAKGVVYIGAGGIFALRASTGDVLWKVDTSADVWSTVVADGVVYGLSRTGSLTSKGGRLYAVRASDGSILWTKKTGYPGDSSTGQAPTVADGIVFIGSATNDLYALDASTGETRWTLPMGEEAGTTPAVVDGVAYAPSVHHIRAIEASTGEVLWSASVEGGGSSPAVVNGVVFVGGEQGLFALDAATGVHLWNAPLGSSSWSSPAVANGVVYVSGSPEPDGLIGSLYALDARTGEVLWNAPIGSGGGSDPRVVNGMVYAGSTNGNVYAFAIP
jgi:outer membrane protein assembly factor BamB